jgi:predicted PurR-regulated permease PerM
MEFSFLEIAGLVVIILVSAFSVAGIVVSIPLFKLINRLRFLSEKLNESLVPAVENLNRTVSNLNSGIGSVSDLTQSISSIVEQLEKIVRLARIIITSPIIKLISTGVGLAEGLRKSASEPDGKKGKN